MQVSFQIVSLLNFRSQYEYGQILFFIYVIPNIYWSHLELVGAIWSCFAVNWPIDNLQLAQNFAYI